MITFMPHELWSQYPQLQTGLPGYPVRRVSLENTGLMLGFQTPWADSGKSEHDFPRDFDLDFHWLKPV